MVTFLYSTFPGSAKLSDFPDDDGTEEMVAMIIVGTM
jgi:hypothetical protein